MATSPTSAYSQASLGFNLNPSLAQPGSLLLRRNASLLRRNASQRVPLFTDGFQERGEWEGESGVSIQAYSPIRANPFVGQETSAPQGEDTASS